MVRTNEGGSILSFVVVGAILAALLLGGVFAVRQHFVGAQKETSAPQEVTKTDKTGTTDTTPAPAAPDSHSTTSSDGTPSSDSSTPTPTPAPAPDSTSAPATTGTTGSTSSTPTPPSTTLPHTGPVETTTTMVALALLSGSVIAYVQSRRAVKSAYRLPSASI